MKTLLKLEYVAGLILSMYLFSLTNSAWWLYFVLFFTPDIAMVGYLINTKIGAICYNLTHHLGIVVVLYVLGRMSHAHTAELLGAVWLGHLYFDRVFGYGLKYTNSFKNTHLGTIG